MDVMASDGIGRILLRGKRVYRGRVNDLLDQHRKSVCVSGKSKGGGRVCVCVCVCVCVIV
jgi:hypothetical protein